MKILGQHRHLGLGLLTTGVICPCHALVGALGLLTGGAHGDVRRHIDMGNVRAQRHDPDCVQVGFEAPCAGEDGTKVLDDHITAPEAIGAGYEIDRVRLAGRRARKHGIDHIDIVGSLACRLAKEESQI